MIEIKRYVNFLIGEKNRGLRVLILIACIIVIIFEIKVIKEQKIKLVRLKKEKALVSTIPELEAAFIPKTAAITRVVKGSGRKPMKIMVVRGIINKNGENTALINNTIYNEGDYYGDYKVLKITKEETVLQNEDTMEILYLRYDEK